MIQNGAPGLSGCSSERELALTDVLISDPWILKYRFRKAMEGYGKVPGVPADHPFNASTFWPPTKEG